MFELQVIRALLLAIEQAGLNGHLRTVAIFQGELNARLDSLPHHTLRPHA